MDPAAILALLGELYSRIHNLEVENQQLRGELTQAATPTGGAKPRG